MRKREQAARSASKRAQTMRVYISGLKGHHSLQMGVAYYFRGHYLYSFPAGNPIEPVPFGTKGGISIVGVVGEAAPKWEEGEVEEREIGALRKSVERVGEEAREEEERGRREVERVLEEEGERGEGERERTSSDRLFAARDANTGHDNDSPASAPRLRHVPLASAHGSMPPLSALGRQPATNTAPGLPSLTAYAPRTTWSTYSYTPHDQARFLSDSLPASRLASVANTPYASRPVSPTVRPVASTPHLNQLLTSDRVARALTPVAGTTRFFLESPNPDTDASTEPPSPVPPLLIASPPYSRNKPIGTGRPRRASEALNKAYNEAKGSAVRAPKCAIHGEGCDGVTVTETWKSQRAKETTGFRDLYPIKKGAGDRVMVDWEQLLKEEQEKMIRQG
ncbi:hypothetical protein ACEQ8H_001420 [Pleosporales sp. CAS-2024a]